MTLFGTYINRSVVWAALLAGLLAFGAVGLTLLTGETATDAIWRALAGALAGPVLVAVRRVLLSDWDGDGTPNVLDRTPGSPPGSASAKHLRDVSGRGIVLGFACLLLITVVVVPMLMACGGGQSSPTYEPQTASIEGEFVFVGDVEWSAGEGVDGTWEADGDLSGTYASELCLAPGICQPIDTTSSIAATVDAGGAHTLIWTICYSVPLMPDLQCHEVLTTGHPSAPTDEGPGASAGGDVAVVSDDEEAVPDS